MPNNVGGFQGPICANCGGFGFTLGFNGTDRGGNMRCIYCAGTGIQGMTELERFLEKVN